MSSHPSPPSQDTLSFLSGPPNTWVRVKPTKGLHDYFLTATEDIHPGDIVAKIPLSLAVTSFDAFPLLGLFNDDSADNKVIARILYERFYGTNGTFAKRWIDTFPTNTTNLFLLPDEDLQSIRKYDSFGLWDDRVNVSFGYDNFAKRMKNVQSQYPLMTTLSAFLWGQAQVYKRCFSLAKTEWKLARKLHILTEDEGIQGMACYPLVDLAGFCKFEPPIYPQALSIASDTISVSLVLKSEFPFKAKQRFCMNIGEYNTFQIMLFQGLSYPYNPYDTLKVGLQLGDFGCSGEIEGKTCQFTLKTNEISMDIVAQFRSLRAKKQISALSATEFASFSLSAPIKPQKELILSLLSYRSLLIQALFQVPQHSLRETYRKLTNITEEREQLKLNFAVSVWAGPYVHRGKLERMLLKVLFSSLKLID